MGQGWGPHRGCRLLASPARMELPLGWGGSPRGTLHTGWGVRGYGSIWGMPQLKWLLSKYGAGSKLPNPSPRTGQGSRALARPRASEAPSR